MTNSLLLTAWPSGDDILTSFRFATGYVEPEVYAGDATLTQISSGQNATHYSLIFRCQNCLSWNHNGATGSASTSQGFMILGWANSFIAPTNAECAADASFVQHDNGQSIFGAQLDSNVANPSYTQWAALATATVTGDCSPPASSTSSTPAPTGTPVPTTKYDYIVVGGGAGGIPIADKLSEAGKKVLLIEKGPPSTGRWGGTIAPDWSVPEWLDGTGLTRFDVPGLCNEIWVDSAGIACTDVDRMAGCVLGGGTAVNAGLWFKVSPPWLLYHGVKAMGRSLPLTQKKYISSQTPSTGTTTSQLAGRPATWLRRPTESSPAFPEPTRRRRTASGTCSKVTTPSPAD